MNKSIASAGTLESNDIFIVLEKKSPGYGLQLELDSVVSQLFARQIEQTIINAVHTQGLQDLAIKAIDKGALDCTIRARLTTAIARLLSGNRED